MTKPEKQKQELNSKKNKQSSGIVKKFRKLLMFLLVSGFMVMLAVTFVFWQAVMEPVALTKKSHILNVEKGQSYYKLIDKWHKQGLIQYAPVAKLYTRFFVTEDLKTGAYQIKKDASLAQVLQNLTGTSTAKMVRIQIIEGKRSADLFNVIANTEGVRHELKGLSSEQIIDVLEVSEPHLEGVFAPDTYFFSQNSSDIAILKHLYNRQKNTLTEEWQDREKDLPYKSEYEALIMASIIERETGVASERGKVSAVFVNRLRKGMKLQTDPTVIYGMGDRYKGDIRKKDLREKTAYNTYHIAGLPPTPIALPSKAAIHATLHPDKTEALFFVATGNGGHTFTRTYAEHKQAVAQYLKVIRAKNKNNKD